MFQFLDVVVLFRVFLEVFSLFVCACVCVGLACPICFVLYYVDIGSLVVVVVFVLGGGGGSKYW